jgi:hypothetical protein
VGNVCVSRPDFFLKKTERALYVCGWKLKLAAVTASHRGGVYGHAEGVYMDTQMKAKQWKITSFFTELSVSVSVIRATSFDYADNLQPLSPTSFR